ncbi:MAG: M20/M25/M40 family metallo-hydrolase [Phycisphaerales bacterium]
MIRMPGQSFVGPPPRLNAYERMVREGLRRDIHHLAGTIGQRNIGNAYANLNLAREWLSTELATLGFEVRELEYEADGRTVANIVAEIPGTTRPDEIAILGAHYDSWLGGPGANDNGSGVAATLAIARAFAERATNRTLRFAFFVNEEGPYFKTDLMGSRVYARACRAQNENIVAMMNLDTIGCFLDDPGSQRYPPPFGVGRPTIGNFIAFIGNYGSVRLTRRVVGLFRKYAKVPSQGAVLPGTVPGSGFSDQWSFWMEGYPGVLVSDTGPYRHPEYHSPDDLPDTIDYDRLTLVTIGLQRVGETALADDGSFESNPASGGAATAGLATDR